jgi:hypothetical protein
MAPPAPELPPDSDDVEVLRRAIIDSGFLRDSALEVPDADHPPDLNGTTGSDRTARAIELSEIMQSERASIFGMKPFVADTMAAAFSVIGMFAAFKFWRRRRRKMRHLPEARSAYVHRRSRRRRRHKDPSGRSATHAAP